VELEILACLSRVEQTQLQGVRVALCKFFGEEQKVPKLVRLSQALRSGGSSTPQKLPGVTPSVDAI
jgi:hypothetical protein